MVYLGMDIGTSSCKIAAFNEHGKALAVTMREYPLIFPESGWMELDANTVWENVVECARECCFSLDGAEITAVSVSSQGEAIIPVDKNGKAIYNSIVTFDNRCREEVRRLKELFTNREMVKITGSPIHSMFSLPKIMWIKNNLPDIYQRTSTFMCYGDFISYKLGARGAIDYTMASKTQLFDIKEKRWSKQIIRRTLLDEEKLPEVVPSGEIIGKIPERISRITGITKGALVVAGAHDQSCCAVGAGVLDVGTIMNSLGTTESFLCVDDKFITNKNTIESNILSCAYACEDRYAYLTFLSSSGSILNWYKNQIVRDTTPFNQYDRIAKERHRPSTVRLVPYFAGSGTPYMDDLATGIFSGLTLSTDRIDMYLAILEGTALEGARNIEIMKKCGIAVNEIRCIGGGAKSEIWMQIKADAYGMPLTLMEVNESGAMGAAALAAAAANRCDIKDITEKWCKKARVFSPNWKQHEIYQEIMWSQWDLYYKRRADLCAGKTEGNYLETAMIL